MKLRDLNAAATAFLLTLNPELEGIIATSTHFESMSSNHNCFELEIELLNQDAWGLFQNRTGGSFDNGKTPSRKGYVSLEDQLDHWRIHDPEDMCDFELAGLKWVIGDGDDQGAVMMLGSRRARVWVRSWPEGSIFG